MPKLLTTNAHTQFMSQLALLTLSGFAFACSTHPSGNHPAHTPAHVSSTLSSETPEVARSSDSPAVAAPATDPKELANTLAQGVGITTRTSDALPGPVVVALEERHNSRIGQLQHAVMLVRMHDRYSLKSVVLEGYLLDDPEINTDWFTKSVRENTPEARASVAVQLLKQGEISAVEFFKLVYPDTKVSPGEKREDYEVDPPTSVPMIDYLKAIARVNNAKAFELAKPYQDIEIFKRMSGEEKAESARNIRTYAEQHNIAVDPSAAAAMKQFINFFERRMASNATIAGMLEKATTQDAIVVATNIGSDHSPGLAKLLSDGKRAYAIVSPLYSPGDSNKGDLSNEQYERKNQSLPIFKRGLSQLVLEAVRGKKPRPVLIDPPKWGQASAEVRGSIASLTEAAFRPTPGASQAGAGGVGQPPGDSVPPFGFAPGDFDGKHIKIDPAAAVLLKRQDGRQGLLIPVTFKGTGEKLWVVSKLHESSTKTDLLTVEQMVLAALRDVAADTATVDRGEATNGFAALNDHVDALFGKDPGELKKAFLISG